MEAGALQTANDDIVHSGFYGTFVFVPVVDGTFILERPTDTLAKGQVNGVRDRLCYIFLQLMSPKQVLLSITNQNEGNLFVDVNETLMTTDYISQVFPDMSHLQVQRAANVYKHYGTPLDQAIQMMGDCESIDFKSGRNATKPISDLNYPLQPSSCVRPTICSRHSLVVRGRLVFQFSKLCARITVDLMICIRASLQSHPHTTLRISYTTSTGTPHPLSLQRILNGPWYHRSPSTPAYNNTQFITAFSQSFMSLAKYYDVNTKFDPTNITPYWNKYYKEGTEMLFNRTEAGEPVITPIKTDPKLLERCGYVCFSMYRLWCQITNIHLCMSTLYRFWANVSVATAQ